MIENVTTVGPGYASYLIELDHIYTFDSDTVCSTRVSEKKVTAINMSNFDSIIFTK